jgi:hypothetical protein
VLTVAGGIILAVLFFVFLPLILRLVMFAVGALFCIAIVGLVGYGIVYMAANSTLPTLHDALTLGGILSIFAGVFLILRARVGPAGSNSPILRLVMLIAIVGGVVALAASVEPSSTVGAVAILIVLIGVWLICHLAFEKVDRPAKQDSTADKRSAG